MLRVGPILWGWIKLDAPANMISGALLSLFGPAGTTRSAPMRRECAPAHLRARR
jgi:hypothetical protein